jgi:hypothetical protein
MDESIVGEIIGFYNIHARTRGRGWGPNKQLINKIDQKP